MASCLQIPMASSHSIASSTTSLNSSKNRVSSIKTRFVVNSIKNVFSNLPVPPANPNDPFLKNLASVASTSPETLLQRPQGFGTLPLLNIFESPKLMGAEAEVPVSSEYRRPRNPSPPPDLPSLILDARVVYIGLPLVSAVTELVVAELFYLQWMDPEAPIYIYINSSGTTRVDGETVALESEGFAIHDVMMMLKNEIITVGLGSAVGQACLLLSAGTKGKRFMLPHATAMIQQPRIPPRGLMQASVAAAHAKEVIVNRDTLVKLLAGHTGNSEEAVADVMKRSFYMGATEAKKFGVIDQILWRGKKIMSDVAATEDKGAGIKAVDAF